MKRLSTLGLATGLLALSGCVIWHPNSLTRSDTTQEVRLRTYTEGFLPGHSGFSWKREGGTDLVVRLRGIKEKYSETEFDILNSAEVAIEGNDDKRGFVSIDRTSRTILIKVYLKGSPFEFNGRHAYTVPNT